MDEIKILKYHHENYFPEDSSFRFAESEGQHVMRNLQEPKISEMIIPPLDLLCIINVMVSQGRLTIMTERQRP